MHMIAINYSTIRFNLTEALHNLESLKEAMISKNRSEEHISEVDYWISSLDLLRNCLYGCKNNYKGQLDILASIKEIKTEITNFIVVTKDFRVEELKRLDSTWSLLMKTEKILRRLK